MCPFLFVPAADAAVSCAPQSTILSLRFSEKLTARIGRSAYAPRAPSKVPAAIGKKKKHLLS